MYDLKDRVALITGGSGDIGKALCEAFARAGAKVATTSRKGVEALGPALDAIRAAGSEALPLAVDVRERAQVEAAVEKAVDTWGKLDILVNNAGIMIDAYVMVMADEQWDAVIDTDLTGVFLMTQAAIKPMIRARYGRIISISSVVGQAGSPGKGNYASAKAGVIGFTKTAARELASRGITVNAVAPGYIESRMMDSVVWSLTDPEKAKERFMRSIPLQKPGKPTDVAYAAVFLACDEASYITGQVLNVNGGLLM